MPANDSAGHPCTHQSIQLSFHRFSPCRAKGYRFHRHGIAQPANELIYEAGKAKSLVATAVARNSGVWISYPYLIELARVIGGGSTIRTADPLIDVILLRTLVSLSQTTDLFQYLVPAEGFEPPTP
jgi:hypothetical protein